MVVCQARRGWKKVAGMATVLLLLCFYYLSVPHPGNNRLSEHIPVFQSALFSSKPKVWKALDGPTPHEPSTDFEVTRRLINSNLQEASFFFTDHLNDFHQRTTKMSQREFEHIMKESAERIRVLQYDLKRLSQMDGAGSWREREAEALSELVQRRLHRLQNPPDCATARKLICDVNWKCGLGCQLHYVIYCFMVAYGSHRTVILNSAGWSYSPKGWEEVFQPLSDTCTTVTNETITTWPGNDDAQTIQFPKLKLPDPKPQHTPLAVPLDISERLIRLHGNPGAWWVGQFLKYMFKFQPYMQEIINTAEKSMQFQHPIVGVHVRRTDKKTEAPYHSLQEYMEKVEEYFAGLQLSNPNITRVIYLASDEPKVFKEAQRKYPQYKILYHKKTVEVVKSKTRYSLASLKDLVMDIYFLSHTDYIVVTLSSNIGRRVYEMMQSLAPDASASCYSLDNTYHFHSQRPNFVRTRFSHQSDKGKKEIVQRGTTLRLSSWFRNFRKDFYSITERKDAFIPYYKLEPVVDVVNVNYSYLDQLSGVV